jgi:TatA/E family protein of Tat protein translocase
VDLGLDNPVHIAIVLVIVLVLFGVKRLPEIGRSLGEAMRGSRTRSPGPPTARWTPRSPRRRLVVPPK